MQHFLHLRILFRISVSTALTGKSDNLNASFTNKEKHTIAPYKSRGRRVSENDSEAIASKRYE